MSKVIDLSKSVYELAKEYPEVIDLMAGIGFTEIRKMPVLHSVGKIMTIPKGSVMKNISMEKIRAAFEEAGFTLTEGNKEEASSWGEEKTEHAEEKGKSDLTAEERNRLLKSYLTRLSEGEELESVRKDFVSHFKDVEASEIMKAEQELIRGGAPITEVQKLCDVHCAFSREYERRKDRQCRKCGKSGNAEGEGLYCLPSDQGASARSFQKRKRRIETSVGFSQKTVGGRKGHRRGTEKAS